MGLGASAWPQGKDGQGGKGEGEGYFAQKKSPNRVGAPSKPTLRQQNLWTWGLRTRNPSWRGEGRPCGWDWDWVGGISWTGLGLRTVDKIACVRLGLKDR